MPADLPSGDGCDGYRLCEVGAFRVRIGALDDGDMPNGAVPGASVLDGTGRVLAPPGSQRILPAPQAVTVRGYGPTSLLTYRWT